MLTLRYPVFEILSLNQQNSLEIPQKLLSTDYAELFEFQRFDKNVVEMAKSKMGSQRDLLVEIGYKFPFVPNVMQKISSNFCDSEPECTFQGLAILNSYLSWLIIEDIDAVETVLDSLFSLLKTKLAPITSICIENCISICLESKSIINKSYLFEYVQNFFLQLPSIAFTVQNILVLMMKFLNPHQKKENDSLASRYISFLTVLSNENQNLFTQETACALLYHMNDRIIKLEPEVLSIYGGLSKALSDSASVSIAILLPMPLISYIESSKPSFQISVSNKVIDDIEEYISTIIEPDFPQFEVNIQGKYSFPEKNTFSNGLDIKLPLFLKEQPLVSMIRADLLSRVQMISRAVNSHTESSEVLMTWLSQYIKKSKCSPHILDLILVFIALFYDNLPKKLFPFFWDTLIETVLFDSRINEFNKNEAFYAIDQIRALAFSIALNNSDFIQKMLVSFYKKPPLIAEVMHRILEQLDNIPESVLISNQVVKPVSSLMIYFQSCHLNCNKDQELMIEVTRSSLFLFVSKVIEKYASAWFSFSFFSTAIFTMLFEQSVREFVLSLIKTYLIMQKIHISVEIIKEIINICRYLFQHFPSTKHLTMSSSIINTLNEVLSHKHNDMCLFKDIVDDLCEALEKLEPRSDCEEFLNNGLRFFAIVAPYHSLISAQFSLISSSILKVTNHNISDSTFSNLIQIAAGNQISSISPYFIIKQPKALKSLLIVTRNSNQMNRSLEFIHSLIKFSYHNARMANKSGIDRVLLDMIESKKSDDDQNNEVIQSIFNIVSDICIHSSSIPVMQHFFRLLRPIEGRYLSNYHSLFIKNLIQIINQILYTPSYYIPLDGSLHVVIEDISSFDIGNQYEISLWLYVDNHSSQKQISIFQLLDQNDCGLFCYISSGTVLLKCSTSIIESTAKFDICVPTGVWTFLSFFINCPKTRTGIFITSERQKSRKVEFDWKGFVPGPLRFFISSPVFQNREEIVPIFLSSVLFTKSITEDELESLAQNGPNYSPVLDFPFFNLSFLEEEGEIAYNTSGSINIQPKINGNKQFSNPSFIDVILSLSKNSIITPLFSFFDVKFKNGKDYPEIPDLICDLLHSVLKVSEDVQRSFAESKGFEMISYIISQSKTFPRTYGIYSKFVMMLQTFTVHELQLSIIDSIITNFSILLLYNRVTQLRIVKHWRRVLLVEYPGCFVLTKPAHVLLAASRLYFDKNDDLSQSINECIMQLVVDVSNISFSLNAFMMLIIDAITTTNQPKLETYLNVLQSIVMNSESIKGYVGQISNIVLLNHVLASGNDNVFCILVDIILKVHAYKLLPNISLSDHIELLMHKVTQKCCTHHSIHHLSYLINNNNPEFVPLACFIASNIGEDSVYSLFDVLQPIYKMSITCLLWIVASAVRPASDVRRKILNYLILCKSDPKEICYLIDIACESLDEDRNSMINEFILLLSDNLLLNSCSDSIAVESFFSISFERMFFHSFIHSLVLKKAFSESPYPYSDDSSDKCSGQYECSFSKIKTKSLMSQSFIFIDSNDELANEIKSSENKLQRCNSLCKTQFQTVKAASKKRRQSDMSDVNNIKIKSKRGLYADLASVVFRPMSETKFSFPLDSFYERIEKYSMSYRNCVFIIRTDRNGRWLDHDLSIKYLQLFLVHPITAHYRNALLIASILVKFQPGFLDSWIPSLSPTPSQIKTFLPFFQYLHKNLVKYHKRLKPSFLDQIQDNKSSALNVFGDNTNPDSIEFSMPYRIAHDISKRNVRIVNCMLELMNLENPDTIGFSLREAKRLMSNEEKRNGMNKREWNVLWRSMTLDLSPWESSGSVYRSGFERDWTLCKGVAPMKIRRIWKLSQDLSVSFASPISSNVCIMVTLIRERESQYEISKSFFSIKSGQTTKTIYYTSIKFCLLRNRMGIKNCLEFFFYNGRTLYLSFPDENSRFVFLKQISSYLVCSEFVSVHDSTPNDFLEKMQIFQKWKCNEISNFEFVMYINMACGRSFKDRYQYPIFPWIISDYQMNSFSMSKETLRDITKPLALLNNDRLERLLKKGSLDYSPITYHNLESYISGSLSIRNLYQNSINKDDDFKELIPEFYSYSGLFNQNQMPPWAESTFDFIYKNRKALEIGISKNSLIRWIDNTFGLLQKGPNSTFPNTLYSSYLTIQNHHNKEQEITFGSLPMQVSLIKLYEGKNSIFEVSNDSNLISFNTELPGVVFASCKPLSCSSNIEITFILQKGLIQSMGFEIHGDKSKQYIIPQSNISFDPFFVSSSMNDSIVQINYDTYLFANGISSSLLLLHGKQTSNIKASLGMIKSIAGDGKYFAAVGSNMVIKVWNIIDMSSFEFIPSYRDYTLCVSLSDQFSLIVSGTRDGSIQISSLPNGVTQRVIPLDNRRPLRICISKVFGFIIVYCEKTNDIHRGKELILFTVNGDKLKELSLQSELICWTQWEESGTDFLSISLKNGKLYSFETYSFQINTFIHRFTTPPTSISHVQKPNMIAAFSKSGIVTMIPYNV